MPMAVPGAMPPGGTGNAAPPSAPPPVGSPMGGPAAPGAFPPMPVDPASVQYATETQADGTILLRIKNPDGTTGPVVQLIPPPKQKGAK